MKWLFAACACFAACTAANPKYCETEGDCDGLAFCDVSGIGGLSNTCIDTNSCSDFSACDDSIPVCDPGASQCAYCAADPGQCQLRDATRPFCGQDGQCAECVTSSHCPSNQPTCSDGRCVACASSNECAQMFEDRPMCNADGLCVQCVSSAECVTGNATVCGGDGLCRACFAHDECDSGVCDKAGGSCVAEANIVRVSAGGVDAANCGRVGETPCQSLDVAAIAADADDWVLVEGVITLLDGPTFEKSVRIAGGPSARISIGDLAQGLFIQCNNCAERTDLTLDGITVTGGNPAVRCFKGIGTGAGLILRDAIIDDGTRLGVDSDGCFVEIERSIISDRLDGGAVLSEGTVAVRNSVIVRNGATTGTTGPGLDLSDLDSASLEFLTVAGNDASGNKVSGVQCDDPYVLANSIVVSGSGIAVQGCLGDYSFSQASLTGGSNLMGNADDVKFENAPSDFRLKSDSPCVDAADPKATDGLDLDRAPRIRGVRADIGAYER